MKTPMNICYCLNKRNEDLCLLSAKSFIKHNQNVHFYIIHSQLNDDFKKFFQCNATFIKPDMSLITNEFSRALCGFRHVSIECFLRLLIPYYIRKEDRVLYVDTDTLCLDNIREFYDTDFENMYYFVGVRGISYSDEQAKMLNLPHYINSGVLLFNNKLLNQNAYWLYMKRHWRGSLGKQKPFSADETVINWCFHDKIKLANEKYNYCYNRNYGNRTIKCLPKILHFVGCNKSAMLEYNYG